MRAILSLVYGSFLQLPIDGKCCAFPSAVVFASSGSTSLYGEPVGNESHCPENVRPWPYSVGSSQYYIDECGIQWHDSYSGANSNMNSTEVQQGLQMASVTALCQCTGVINMHDSKDKG